MALQDVRALEGKSNLCWGGLSYLRWLAAGGAMALQDVRALEGGVAGTGNSTWYSLAIALGGAGRETPPPSAGRPAEVLKGDISLMSTFGVTSGRPVVGPGAHASALALRGGAGGAGWPGGAIALRGGAGGAGCPLWVGVP